MDAIDIPVKEKKQVPNTASGRIKKLLELPLKEKVNFVPPVGFKFVIGPFKYEVAVVNAGQLRFTAKLIDVNIVGVNSESPIIDPETGEGFKVV